MAYVFQYGSNTSTSRFNAENRLRGDARSLGAVYTEEDFELDFDVWSNGNKCAAADIISGRGRKVWGVLYEIPDYLIERETSGERRSLDAIEGGRYERRKIALRHPNGSPVNKESITYVVRENERQTDIQTSLDYCRHIITGLREHNVPNEYIEYAKARMIANNPSLRGGLMSVQGSLVARLGLACMASAIISGILQGVWELAHPILINEATFASASVPQRWGYGILAAIKSAGFLAGLYGLFLVATRRGWILKIFMGLAVLGGVFFAAVWFVMAATTQFTIAYVLGGM
jgi:hypothetical protein